MQISQAGVDAIKQYEALRLHAYLDGGGVPTIGYGSTKGVHMGDEITEEEAEDMLEWDLAEAEEAVRMFVGVELEQNEFDALTSFTFNCGVNAFHGSTLLRLLNGGTDRVTVAQQFLRWDKIQGVPSKGLHNRREAERKMFLGLS